MSKCPNCGGDLNFNPKDSVVICKYCGSKFNPKEFITKTEYVKEEETFEGKSYNCTQCGAELLAFDETAITFCSYCGSQSIIESKMIKVNNPDYIIPFKKTKEECIQAYKNHLNKALFVPKYMKSDMTIQKIRGIYMPYGIYKTSIHGNCQNKGEKYSHRSGDYVYYDVYTITSHVDADYEGLSFDLQSKFYDNYSMNIPFDFNGIEKFNKNYLMGYYADTVDVDGEIYNDDAEKITSNDSTRFMKKRKEFRKYGCSAPKAKLLTSERKHGMFPVYFLGVKDNQGNMHYAVINGQTGKVASDLPIDFTKFIIGTIILSIIIFTVLYFGVVVLPKTVLIISIVAAALSMLVSSSQLKKVYDREHHFDDEGYLSKNEPDAQYIVRESNFAPTTNSVLLLILLLVFFIFIIGGALIFLSYFNTTIYFIAMFAIIALGIFLISKIMHSVKNTSNKKIEVYKDGKKVKKVKISDFKLQLISLIFGLLVLITGTIRDEIYYGAAIVIFILIIISFKKLIDEHNILSSNKPPQLEKRGGEEVGK